MMAKKVLTETLNDLSSEELEEFKSLIEYEKDFPPISRGRLSAANKPNLVELLVDTNGKECVKWTKNVLRKMKRTDLEQRLSDSSLDTKDKQWCPLIQRVEAVASVTELLLETLEDLSDWEFDEFKYVLWNQFAFYRHFSRRGLQMADRQDTVFSFVLTDCLSHVEKTRVALKRINRIDLVKRLSCSSSEPKKKHSLDESLSRLIHKVATMKAVKELLFTALGRLSDRELKKFCWLLQFIMFHRRPSDVSWRQLQELKGLNDLVGAVVEVCGQHSVEVTKEVLLNMNRSDLVQELSEASSEHKAAGLSAQALGVNTTERVPFSEKHCMEEPCPALTQKVDTMESVIELLLETMAGLNDREHANFKDVLLQKTDFSKHISAKSLRLLEDMHKQHTVFLMVQAEGDSVETTSIVLKMMGRPDLVQRLSEGSSALREKQSEENRPELIQGIAEMAAVQQLLLETLNDLSDEDLNIFKCILEETVSQKNLQFQPSSMTLTKERAELVALLVHAYGKKAFDLTWEVVTQMNRTNLMQKLSEPSSGLKEKHSEQQPALSERETKKHVLRVTLEDLSIQEFEKFKFLLQFTYFQKGLPTIPMTLLESEYSIKELVHLIVENQQPVEVTKEVFMDMNRPDLVEILSATTSGLKDEHHSETLQKQVSSDWTKVEPEVTNTDEAQTYSLQTEAGSFECSISGLRWVCKEKVSFKYRFCSTKYHMERIESIKFIPAGPLVDITVSAGKLDIVYLPHWICIADTTLLDKFAVLHIHDFGHAVEKVSEVTSSHVKLCEPGFSLLMTVLKWFGTSIKIHCKVLLYKTKRPFLKLHVYLLPPDPALIKELDEIEKSHGYERIRTQHPKTPLKMNEWFILTAHVDGKEMASDELMLIYESTEPNFYQLFIRNPDKDIELQLKKKNKLRPVWTCEILKEEYQSTGPVQDRRVGNLSIKDKQLSVPVQKEAITEDEKRLLEMLKDLSLDQFKEFKWHLRSIITWDQLENSDRLDVVKLMWQSCTQESFDVTKNVLKEINRNDLVQMLSDANLGSKATGSSA